MKLPTKAKTLPQLIKEADDLFSKVIRARDTQADGFIRCFICGAKLRFAEAQAMHYIVRDEMPTRYDELNVHGGCESCNCYDPEHHHKYHLKMIDVYGIGPVQDLRTKSRSLQKFMRFELEEMIASFKERLKLKGL